MGTGSANICTITQNNMIGRLPAGNFLLADTNGPGKELVSTDSTGTGFIEETDSIPADSGSPFSPRACHITGLNNLWILDYNSGSPKLYKRTGANAFTQLDTVPNLYTQGYWNFFSSLQPGPIINRKLIGSCSGTGCSPSSTVSGFPSTIIPATITHNGGWFYYCNQPDEVPTTALADPNTYTTTQGFWLLQRQISNTQPQGILYVWHGNGSNIQVPRPPSGPVPYNAAVQFSNPNNSLINVDVLAVGLVDPLHQDAGPQSVNFFNAWANYVAKGNLVSSTPIAAGASSNIFTWVGIQPGQSWGVMAIIRVYDPITGAPASAIVTDQAWSIASAPAQMCAPDGDTSHLRGLGTAYRAILSLGVFDVNPAVNARGAYGQGYFSIAGFNDTFSGADLPTVTSADTN
jgi:hypothetical protein